MNNQTLSSITTVIYHALRVPRVVSLPTHRLDSRPHHGPYVVQRDGPSRDWTRAQAIPQI